MRRGVAAAAIVSLLVAGAAWADGTITARTPNMFAQAVTTIDQGEKVTLRNTDIAGHDVTAHRSGDDGKPLFRSDLIAPGQSGPVRGTEYLTTGTYDFFCSVHPGMDAKLQVTSAGTPVPRPEPSGGLRVKVVSKDLQRVLDSRKVKLRVSSAKASVTVGARAKAGKKSIALGSKKVDFAQEGTKRVTLKLSDSARKALRKRASAKLIATATASSGGRTERTTAKRTLD